MSNFIPVAVPDLSGNEKKYVMDCMDTTWISSGGEYIKRFEDSFSSYIGTKNALSCCNGTVALHLPLLVFGVGPGDEVILPSLTFVATANAVRYCGATPVLADSLPDTWNIDPHDMEKKITPRTKAIIPVHLYGNPCDMDSIMDIAKAHNLFVLEDAAECHGACYNGKRAGSIGDAGTFSFFGNKIITTGEGGMIVTDNDEFAYKMRMLKGQGQDPNRRYWFNEVGYNYRMTNIEAAIGLAQLENIDSHISARKKVTEWYMDEFESISDFINFQQITPKAENVWWMFSILVNDKSAIGRDELMLKLLEDGIETRPIFYPMHIMPPYYDKNAGCPVSAKIAAAGLNLPTHAKLSRENISFICGKIKKYVAGV
jgi:perosamine synthetase